MSWNSNCLVRNIGCGRCGLTNKLVDTAGKADSIAGRLSLSFSGKRD